MLAKVLGSIRGLRSYALCDGAQSRNSAGKSAKAPPLLPTDCEDIVCKSKMDMMQKAFKSIQQDQKHLESLVIQQEQPQVECPVDKDELGRAAWTIVRTSLLVVASLSAHSSPHDACQNTPDAHDCSVLSRRTRLRETARRDEHDAGLGEAVPVLVLPGRLRGLLAELAPRVRYCFECMCQPFHVLTIFICLGLAVAQRVEQRGVREVGLRAAQPRERAAGQADIPLQYR